MNDFLRILEAPQLKGMGQSASLVFARLLPIIALTPVFGGQLLPRRVRLSLGILLTVVMVPLFVPRPGQVQVIPNDQYVVLLAKEAVVGLTIAIIVLMLFEAIAAFGALVDLARGATISNVFDPLTQNQQSILATFFSQAAVVLFMSVGGLRLLIKALGDSFVTLRPLDLLPAQLFGPGAVNEAAGLVADLFLLAVRLATPAMAVLLLVDFALAVINRVSPQIQVYFMGMTTKGVIGLMVIFVGLGLTFELLVDQFGAVLDTIRKWVTATPGGG
ncbi:MAG: EscT/YscT/HrcT family type III secretion system export apparatus protein [Phycisphaerae bacterium]|nr:flagellar biosynthetic protein FliR [Tepidisphaeraceae bacterium]